jgi:LacI family transcriptional regulator
MNKVKSQQRVVLRQVASLAGVSLGTASNVFADKPGVSLKARLAVLAAAKELGYQPQPRTLARQLPPYSEQTNFTTFGLVIRSMQIPFPTNPFYSPVLHGAENACTAQHVSLMYAVVEVSETSDTDIHLPLMVQRKQTHGLLVVGYFPETFFALLQKEAIPFVTVDYYDPGLQVDSVTGADEEGGYLATKYLLAHGFRQPIPAMIAGPFSHTSLYYRWRGYKRALEEEGLTYNEDYVRYGDTNFSGGYHAMCELLEVKPRPEAIFCSSDMTALGALNALNEHGIKVPEECSLIGYDDIDLAAITAPPLTTVHVDKRQLGIQGVRQLLERLSSPEMPPLHTSIAVTIVERRSVQQKE